jgi:hypothetical protein
MEFLLHIVQLCGNPLALSLPLGDEGVQTEAFIGPSFQVSLLLQGLQYLAEPFPTSLEFIHSSGQSWLVTHRRALPVAEWSIPLV